jgi:DNA polymerase V
MNNDIAIVSFNNSDYTVKRYDKNNNMFTADNPEHKNIEVLEEDIVQCLGIVKHIIRDL